MNEFTRSHSKVGIASCVIALATFLIFLLDLVFWTNTIWCPGCFGELGSNFVLAGLVIWFLLPIPALVGLILGAVSFFFPNRMKLFPVIGIVLNLIVAVIGMFPILLGVALAA